MPLCALVILIEMLWFNDFGELDCKHPSDIFQDQGGGIGESQMHSELWWIEVVSNKQPLRGLKACWDIRQFKISSFGMIQILIKNSWVLLLLCFTGATYIRCLRIGYVENWSIGRPPDGTKTYRWKGCLERTKDIFTFEVFGDDIILPYEVLPTSRVHEDLSSVNENSSKHEQ